MKDANGLKVSEMTDIYWSYPQKQVKFPLLSLHFLALYLGGKVNSLLCFHIEIFFLSVSKIILFQKLPNNKIKNLVHLVFISLVFIFVLMTDFSFLVFLWNVNLCRCVGSSIEDCIGLMDRYLVCFLPMFFLQGSMREHWCMCVHATVDGEWCFLFCNCLQV